MMLPRRSHFPPDDARGWGWEATETPPPPRFLQGDLVAFGPPMAEYAAPQPEALAAGVRTGVLEIASADGLYWMRNGPYLQQYQYQVRDLRSGLITGCWEVLLVPVGLPLAPEPTPERPPPRPQRQRRQRQKE